MSSLRSYPVLRFLVRALPQWMVVLILCAQSAWAIPWTVLYDQQAFSDLAGPPPPQVGVNTYSLRGLALSDDDAFFYSGWLHQNRARGVYQHNATTGAILNTYNLDRIQANCVATDDRGYVYIGYGVNGSGQIEIRNSTLSTQIAAPFNGGHLADVEGVSVWDDGLGTYYLYVSRADRTIERWNVSTPSAPVLDTTWATNGVYTVSGVGVLRGLEVADDGTIFLTQRDTTGVDRVGFIYRIDSLLNQTVASLSGPMDVAVFGDRLYVSQYLGLDSAVAILDGSDLSYLGTLTPDIRPVLDLYGYAGIDMSDNGRIYLADQWYDALGAGPPTWVRDRVLLSEPVPEPASLGLLGIGLGLVALWHSRGRRRGSLPA